MCNSYYMRRVFILIKLQHLSCFYWKTTKLSLEHYPNLSPFDYQYYIQIYSENTRGHYLNLSPLEYYIQISNDRYTEALRKLTEIYALLNAQIWAAILGLLQCEVESVESEAGFCSLSTSLKTLRFLLACERHRFLHALRSTNQNSDIRSIAFIMKLAKYICSIQSY